MALPRSFQQAGFLPPKEAAMGGRKFRRLMVGTEGEGNTGKTEFAWSCPGPMMMLGVDRNFDGTLDNTNPPKERCKDIGIKVITAPGFTQSSDKSLYMDHWSGFYRDLVGALTNPDARTVFVDGDSDTYELQRMAEFGTLTNVPGKPGVAYTNVKAARRVLYRRMWDSGKFIICTNKVKNEYGEVRDAAGNFVMEGDQPKRVKTGHLERQGFDDYEYLWHFQLRHLRRDPTFNPITKTTSKVEFGIEIMMCKAQPGIKGDQLWGADCNMRSLLEYAYPHIPLSEWGYL